MEGDRHAATSLIRGTEKLVAQIVFKMLRHPADRKDLFQDIYLKTFKSLPRFRFQCKLSTWVAQISYSSCLDFLQKMKPGLLGDLGNEIPEEERFAQAQWIDRPNNPDQVLTNKERAAILGEACAKLPEVYNTLVTLFHKEALSLEEISAITDLPVGTIKSYLFRARKMLKDQLLKRYSKEEL